MSNAQLILNAISTQAKTAKEIAEELNISVPAVTGSLASLKKQNFVTVEDGKLTITLHAKEFFGLVDTTETIEEVVPVVKVQKKTDLAREIFKEMFGKFARKDVIQQFMSKAGLTQQGAATYYYNFSKEAKQK